MTINFNEERHSNESIQSDHNLQILIKQIDEIKDTIKDNDKVEGVFEETPEGQTIKKSLKQGLKESLYQNPDTCKMLVEEINRLLKDSSLQLEDDIRDSLVSLGSLLNGILNDFIISDNTTDKPDTNEDETYTEEDFIIPDDATDNPKAPENETIEDTPASLEFLDSLTEDDLISLCDNENRSKIKKELIKEENGKEYIIIKGKRFNIESMATIIYEQNNNIIQISPGAIYLGGKNYYIRFQRKYGIINILKKGRSEAAVVKRSDGQILRTYENKDGHFRASNGISIRSNIDTTTYRFYSNNNSVLSLSSIVAQDAFYEITSILSRIKDSKEQCKIVDENTLQVGDTNYKFPEGVEINEIAEWINNYYN